MTRKLQILRGTTAQNNAYTGAVGELTMDTDRNEVRIHDGQTVGGIKISDRNMPILTSMFFDHVVNDMSWLRADTFSWQSGDVYVAAYNHLADDIDGKTLQSETIGSTTIQFYLADDGHKICPASEESNVTAIYNATGVAWYFILDTENKQFKLPRSKHNKYANTVPVVGNNTNIGWTDGTTEYIGKIETYSGVGITTIFATGDAGQLPNNNGSVHVYDMNNKGYGLTTDPEKSGLIAQQEQDTDQYKYLYFYVGNFEQSAIEQTAGISAEMFNGKADIDLGNLPTNIDYVVESQLPTSENGYTWYRKHKSGWVEQGGRLTQSGSATLPIEMSNNNYNLQVRLDYNDSAPIYGVYWYATKTTTGFTMGAFETFIPVDWQVSGMAAQ